MKRGSFHIHSDWAVYLLGYRAAHGDILIRRSVDGGRTWTEPKDENTGLLRRGTFGGTPNRSVIHDERIWFAQDRRLLSAPVDSDLLRAAPRDYLYPCCEWIPPESNLIELS